MYLREGEMNMAKKKYVSPIAMEESFNPNEYIALCDTTSQMRCMNPYHRDHYDSYYFTTAVFTTEKTCTQTLIASNALKTTTIGDSNEPARNAWVYTVNGTALQTTQTYTVGYGRNRKTYYVPATVTSADSPCYGAYKNGPSETTNHS